MKKQINEFLHKENSVKKIVNTNSKKVELYKLIKKHGDNLKKLFKLDNSVDSVKLCKSLFRLEFKAQKLALEYCNYGNLDNKAVENILKKVGVILNITDTNQIFFNGDARGYALKINDDFIKGKEIFTDWGGYGIIAPDLSGYLIPITPPARSF